MTMHQAAVKFCMAEDVGGSTKAAWLVGILVISLLEVSMMGMMFWDRGCTTHDQCKQGVSACWDLEGKGYTECHHCHDFYIDRTCKANPDDDEGEPGRCSDENTELLWDHIQWRATIRGDAPPWEDNPDPIQILHPYAGQHLPPHVNNASFSCLPDDVLCQQCFNANSRKFGRWGDTDVATDNMRAMRKNDWFMLAMLAFFSGTMGAGFVSDIATQVMLMNRALKSGTPGVMPFVIFFNWLAAARHFCLGSMFIMFNTFARVHHDSGHAKDQGLFALQCFLVLNFSRIVYAYAVPPHIRKTLADKEPEYEATEAELNTVSWIRIIHIFFVSSLYQCHFWQCSMAALIAHCASPLQFFEAPVVSLYAVRDTGDSAVPPLHLMTSFLIYIAYGALYPAESTVERLKNVGLQFARFIVGFITFGILDNNLFE